MQRIMVTGPSGSGKSTLARKLSGRLNLPVIHGDHFYYDAGWAEKSGAETVALFNRAADGARWIIDGNNSASMAYRAERADLIVYLDIGRTKRLARTFWRSLRYFSRTRPDMPDGCHERLDWAFLIGWVWKYPSQDKMERFMQEWVSQRPVLWLRTSSDVRRFLQDPHAEVQRLQL